MSLIHGFLKKEIKGRCLISVQSQSENNQPIYMVFDGGVTPNHLMTLPSKKSFTAILEANGELHYNSSLDVEVRQVDQFCRFDFKIINESEIFELPAPPYSVPINLDEWSAIWSTDRPLLATDSDYYVETGLHSRLSGYRNTAIGENRNHIWQGILNHQGSSTYRFLGLYVRDHFLVAIGVNASGEFVAKMHIAGVDTDSTIETGTLPDLIAPILPFGSNPPAGDFCAKVRAYGDLIAMKFWLPENDEPLGYQAEFDIKNAVLPDGVTIDDLHSGHCGLINANRGGDIARYKQMQFETINI